MAATFFSGFKDQKSALNFLLDNIYTGFQIHNSICVVLKDERQQENFKKAQQQKYFENSKLEYLYDKNISFIAEEPSSPFDEIHIFSDKVMKLSAELSDEVYVYTTSSDEAVNKASRELYANLKKDNFELKHEAI
tara:strand:- start:3303 stop:3707 length:405 start_codon:yes stop_codon:yes gene_type:complete